MIVINRFRFDSADEPTLRSQFETALEALSSQKGYVAGHLGRCVDDPDLWLLQTQWANVGSYRRALSAYDVKLHAWALLGQALDEPSAYEIVTAGEPTNDPLAREPGGH